MTGWTKSQHATFRRIKSSYRYVSLDDLRRASDSGLRTLIWYREFRYEPKWWKTAALIVAGYLFVLAIVACGHAFLRMPIFDKIVCVSAGLIIVSVIEFNRYERDIIAERAAISELIEEQNEQEKLTSTTIQQEEPRHLAGKKETEEFIREMLFKKKHN